MEEVQGNPLRRQGLGHLPLFEALEGGLRLAHRHLAFRNPSRQAAEDPVAAPLVDHAHGVLSFPHRLFRVFHGLWRQVGLKEGFQGLLGKPGHGHLLDLGRGPFQEAGEEERGAEHEDRHEEYGEN
jgi:hypothetical protein